MRTYGGGALGSYGRSRKGAERLAERFQLTDGSPQEREVRRKQVKLVQKEIDRARGELRQGASIARSVELNVLIQDLKKRLAKELETL